LLKRAVFLDRDGTLIENRGYICSFREVRFFDDIVKGLRLIRSLGYLTVVVTNQSAVARGICTESQVRALHRDMNRYLQIHGVGIHGFYYCPYHREGTVDRYRKESGERKPRPGMLIRAGRDLGIDLETSYMVGDDARDMEAGRAAGCRTILVRSGAGTKSQESSGGIGGEAADHVVKSLMAAAEVIAGETRKE